jgi:hypothetical protein
VLDDVSVYGCVPVRGSGTYCQRGKEKSLDELANPRHGSVVPPIWSPRTWKHQGTQRLQAVSVLLCEFWGLPPKPKADNGSAPASRADSALRRAETKSSLVIEYCRSPRVSCAQDRQFSENGSTALFRIGYAAWSYVRIHCVTPPSTPSTQPIYTSSKRQTARHSRYRHKKCITQCTTASRAVGRLSRRFCGRV